MMIQLAAPPLPVPRWVAVDRSMIWLSAGWKDMWQTPALSLGFGAVFAVLGLLLTLGLSKAGLGSLILPMAGGFLLIGPLAAAFLYEASRRLEAGLPLGLADVWIGVKARGAQIGNLGMVLLLLMMVWLQAAFLLFAFFMGDAPPALDGFLADILFKAESVPFLLAGSAVGVVLAALAFAVSAFSMPMLIEHDMSVAAAISASVQAVLLNWRNMIGWAASIATIVVLGMACAFVGLVVALPLVAHASWHAYRDVMAGAEKAAAD